MLWDCISLVDEATLDILAGLGGVTAMAISHPHYYHTTMVEWSRGLGDVPIHLHAADRQWVMRPDPAIRHWEGDVNQIGPGLTLLRLGGHFDGGAVLHWADWDGGRGALLSGDILQVVPSGYVSFMWSYPNNGVFRQRMKGWPLYWSLIPTMPSMGRSLAAARSTAMARRSWPPSVSRYISKIRDA